MKLANNKKVELFANPVWFFTIDDCQEMNRRIVNKAYELSNLTSGVTVSNEGGWHSELSFIEDPDMLLLQHFLVDAIDRIACEISLEYSRLKFEMWCNINYPSTFNLEHVHPGCQLSGVYYVKVPNHAGNFIFNNPDPHYVDYTKDKLFSRSVEIKPIEGQMIIFKSSMRHRVGVNMSEEDRISIAFNIITIG